MRRYAQIVFFLAIVIACGTGCRSTSPRAVTVSSQVPATPRKVDSSGPSATDTRGQLPISPIAYQEPAPEPEILPQPVVSPSATAEEIDLQEFVAEVVARYPSVQAMAAAWQAAAQRYPQVVALDDPMFMAMTAPGSLNSATTEGAYALELRQKLPWFGKRNLRGEVAAEQAAAAGHDVDDARLKVTLAAQIVYFEYYLAHQQLELNQKTSDLASEFLESAQVRYRTNQVTQQDVLQAELELAELARRKLEIQRMRRVATARMNTLLLRAPNLPLPPPRLTIDGYNASRDPALLYEWAMQNRPDLAAQGHRVEAESASVALAYKQYYPDTELFGRYDTFWQPASTQGDLRGQVGVVVNLPVYRQKLHAAVSEAQFRLQREKALYDQMAAEIRLDVQTALEQVWESEQTAKLYKERILPAAEQYLAAARSNYEVGKATSLDFVQAQRELLKVREQQLQTTTTLAQRLVELERNLGGSLPKEIP
jgi:outer membrane protein, heavy metal efflux system